VDVLEFSAKGKQMVASRQTGDGALRGIVNLNGGSPHAAHARTIMSRTDHKQMLSAKMEPASRRPAFCLLIISRSLQLSNESELQFQKHASFW
jgi:hypothetical protein